MGPAEGSDAAAGRVAHHGAGVVSRPDLTRRLGASARVTVISAPPGSGKSVLLRSWIGASVRFAGQVFEDRPVYYGSADLYLCPTTIASFGVTVWLPSPW